MYVCIHVVSFHYHRAKHCKEGAHNSLDLRSRFSHKAQRAEYVCKRVECRADYMYECVELIEETHKRLRASMVLRRLASRGASMRCVMRSSRVLQRELVGRFSYICNYEAVNSLIRVDIFEYQVFWRVLVSMSLGQLQFLTGDHLDFDASQGVGTLKMLFCAQH